MEKLKLIKIVTVSLVIIAYVSIFSACSFKSETIAGIEMVQLPGSGEISKFWIGKYEVTQKQYESVMKTNPSYFKNKPDNPVDTVSWYNAIEFCNKLSEQTGFKPYYIIDKINKDPESIPLRDSSADPFKWTVKINKESNGFRLPTFSEWKYAAAAGTKTIHYWGDLHTYEIVNQYEVYQENSYKLGEKHNDYGTHKVGSKKPNPWGLYDIYGNIMEWCFDRRVPDVSPYSKGRIIAGQNYSGVPSRMTINYTGSNAPDNGQNWSGFRLVKNL